jgi:hypothetical protein
MASATAEPRVQLAEPVEVERSVQEHKCTTAMEWSSKLQVDEGRGE